MLSVVGAGPVPDNHVTLQTAAFVTKSKSASLIVCHFVDTNVCCRYLDEVYTPNFNKASSTVFLHPLAASSFSPLGHTSTMALMKLTTVCIAC